MSGISGLVHWDRRPVDSLDLDKMVQAAAHRGPDGVGRQICGPVGMRAFYYRSEPERVLFATEVKQILAVSGVSAELFEPAVAAHLAGCFDHLEAMPCVRGVSVAFGWTIWDTRLKENLRTRVTPSVKPRRSAVIPRFTNACVRARRAL